MEISVPSIACDVCVQTLTKGIVKADPGANVKGNAETKMLKIDTQLTESEVKSIITKLGHDLA